MFPFALRAMTSASRFSRQGAFAVELRVVGFSDDPSDRLTVTGQPDALSGTRTGDHVGEIFAYIGER
jgi:hypothetical protein